MKKFGISIGLALVFGLSAFAGCAATGSQEDAKVPSAEQEAAAADGRESAADGDSGLFEEEGRGEETCPQEEAPAISPLAVLETVDVSAAFGDREAEGWSFALKAEGDLTASYALILTGLGGRERANLECGMRLGLEDVFGLRSEADSALGLGLFGGGNASVCFRYRGPDADSEPVSKDFEVGFRHDGDLIWYAGEGESADGISLGGLKEKIESVAMAEAYERMAYAFSVIPEELNKGVSLRFAVEKLIDLGFAVEIDTSDGVSISLKAKEGFYTDLLNDFLENFMPLEWVGYFPRLDLGFEKTAFDIRLVFDSAGIFREYSMSSDIALTTSLKALGRAGKSVLKLGGAFSFTSYSGDIPDGEIPGSADETSEVPGLADETSDEVSDTVTAG